MTLPSSEYFSSSGLGLFKKTGPDEYSNGEWISYLNRVDCRRTSPVVIANPASLVPFDVEPPSVSELVEHMEATYGDIPYNLGDGRFTVNRRDKTMMYNTVVGYINGIRRPDSVTEAMSSIMLMIYFTSLKSSTASFESIDNMAPRNERVVSYAGNLLALEDRPLDIIETEAFEYSLGNNRKYMKDLLGFCSGKIGANLEDTVSEAYPVFFADDIESIRVNYRLIRERAAGIEQKAKTTAKKKPIPAKPPAFMAGGILR